MERYTADAIERVSVVFDDPDAGDRDDGGESDGDYEPSATVEIEHESEVIDQIDIGPDGAQVLHEMTQTPEFNIDVTARP